MRNYDDLDYVERRLRAAKARLRYWKTVSPSNTRKSSGEGYELAKADVEQLQHFKDKLTTKRQPKVAE